MLHFRMYKNDQIVNPKNNSGNALKNVQWSLKARKNVPFFIK
jgi:hypothetical protein